MAPRHVNRRQLQRMKLHPLWEVIYRKGIGLGDDSVVRSNSITETISMLNEEGASRIDVVVFSGPIKWPCYYGIDMATKKELVAANYEVSEIRELIGADSLSYLTLEGMVEATGLPRENLCMACFDGNYPVNPPSEGD